MSEGINISKIKNDIEDLKSKKNSLQLSVQRDIDDIKKKMTKEFSQAGEAAYKLYKAGTDSMAELTEAFASIDRHKDDIERNEKKKIEIRERYDDEINMLEKLIPAVPEPPKNQQTQSFCTNCGRPYIIGVDIFCEGCGTRTS